MEHRDLIDRIIEMAFYDSEDRDRFTKQDNERWDEMSQSLFGTILTSSDVGDWIVLAEKDVTACGFVVVTFVHCKEV